MSAMASGRPASLTALLRSRCSLFRKLPEVSIILVLLTFTASLFTAAQRSGDGVLEGLDPVAMLFLMMMSI